MVPQIAFWPVCGLPRGASLGRRQRRRVRLSGVILWVSPTSYRKMQYFAYIYIYKEELKTVVRELLACTQPNRHKTSTALWNPYRRVPLRGRRAQIRFSRGARGEKPENDRPPFWFYGESIRTSVFNNTATIQHCTQLVGMSLTVRIAVEARRRRAASASIIYFTIYNFYIVQCSITVT